MSVEQGIRGSSSVFSFWRRYQYHLRRRRALVKASAPGG